MTAIHEAGQRGAATHALVIGVGGYKHLAGGEEPGEQNLGLGQLTSPALSARAIADWLLHEFDNQDAPLGTVELLISPPYKPKRGRRAPRGVQRARRAARGVERATMANVSAAFRRWFDRCRARKKNVALFFFCGHGVRKTNLFLLLEDFGEDPNQLFRNAIDFEGVHRGLASRCRARVQCLFADACRQVAPEVLELIDPRGESFLDGRHDVFFPEDAPLFYSTMPTQSAYGLSDEPTLYTQALLWALRGGAGRKLGDSWVVTTGYPAGRDPCGDGPDQPSAADKGSVADVRRSMVGRLGDQRAPAGAVGARQSVPQTAAGGRACRTVARLDSGPEMSL